ncbi:MAG TPA: class I SAM-dependent methyltransferase [Ramlibacter sp.]|uniref:class I SAM-dependent methyltransferase n=1 Tax=Ramlibacter sp. TaxID=1917967 RepID=UPI002B7721D9|nr:class I SAM-dependent methyltransferase [Ramlibacter sp.]HVZ42266.1 class I SAM-dependent methyltransferase [Ramlibacter sp.]
MQEWNQGYLTEVGYTYGYYEELNPVRAELPLLFSGIEPPARWETACELAFGQGVSINVHAAAGEAQWWGTDFNPDQAAFASDLARVGGAAPKLFDESFEQFCSRADLPEFDFIGLHGVWSWVSDENRRVLVDFIRRKLRLGGLLYISYNTMPGWAGMAPIRHLLTEHTRLLGAPGQQLPARIEAALEFCGKLLSAGSAYPRAYPAVMERLSQVRGMNRNYLAHEYFHRDWEPMPFADMGHWLGEAKLSFACTATYLGLVDTLNLNSQAAEFLREVAHPEFRETVRDLLVNQQFRRDYWVRGARRRTAMEIEDSLRKKVFRLVRPADKVAMTLTPAGSNAPIALMENIYRPLIEALADGRERSVSEIESAVKAREINFGQLAQAMLVLASRGDVAAVQQESVQRVAAPRCKALNEWIMQKARFSSDLSVLASPVTGGGVGVSRWNQLFLAAHETGKRKTKDLAAACWQVLAQQRQVIVKDGKPLQTEAENLAYLEQEAALFLEQQLPILKATGIA